MRIPTPSGHIPYMAQAACPDAYLTQDDQLHWLALRMTPGLGTRKAGQLVNVFRTPQAIFRASRSELEAAGISPSVAQSIASGCAFDEAATQHQKLIEAGAVVIPVSDPHYPPRLRDIFDPPPVLFARGRVDLMQTLMLAIVGTRRPTHYGVTAAGRLAKDLSTAGLTIVSGMARGIDTAAQTAVLESGGDTVAVFGCGVDEVYPAENRKLAAQIAEKGLIISEFPMATPPYPQNFPVRNRIVSGLGAGVLVVEGSEYSGSGITAKLAVEQNREIFAVPGNITSKMSWGPNLLIKQGAKLVQEWNDVVVELRPEDRRRLVDHCRNRLNLNDIQETGTSEGGSSSNYTGSITGWPRQFWAPSCRMRPYPLIGSWKPLRAIRHPKLSRRCSSWSCPVWSGSFRGKASLRSGLTDPGPPVVLRFRLFIGGVVRTDHGK